MNDNLTILGPDVVRLTTVIVTAYVTNKAVTRADLPSLIGTVHAALNTLGRPAAEAVPDLTLRVPIKKSVTPDFLISLADGKPYKALKRHLGKLGLTPDEYRSKWGLPADYPMVAPAYAQRRSELAKSMGLGQQRRKAAKGAPKQTARVQPAAT